MVLSSAVENARISKARRDSPGPLLSSFAVIELALARDPDPYIAWSGGRCSTVVLHMALQVDPDFKVIFNDTGVEFSETYEYVDKIQREWNLNLTVLKPQTTFWAIVKKYGFPMLRGKYDKRKSLSKDGRPMCCQLLKEEPVARACIECTITGIRACESRMRMFAIAQRGQVYYAKTLKRWQYHPLALWSTEELLAYVKKHNIPMNKVYEMGHYRCGCWPCTGYLTWRDSLGKSHPKLYRFLMKQKGEPTLWEYFDDEGCMPTRMSNQEEMS